MSTGTRPVLVATDEPTLALEVSRLRPPSAEFTVCPDGLHCLQAFTQAVKLGRAPALTVLDLSRQRPTPWSTAQMIRAVEAGLGAAPSPLLWLSSEAATPEIEGWLKHLGRSVFLQKSPALDARGLAQTLSATVERLVGASR